MDLLSSVPLFPYVYIHVISLPRRNVLYPESAGLPDYYIGKIKILVHTVYLNGILSICVCVQGTTHRVLQSLLYYYLWRIEWFSLAKYIANVFAFFFFLRLERDTHDDVRRDNIFFMLPWHFGKCMWNEMGICSVDARQCLFCEASAKYLRFQIVMNEVLVTLWKHQHRLINIRISTSVGTHTHNHHRGSFFSSIKWNKKGVRMGPINCIKKWTSQQIYEYIWTHCLVSVYLLNDTRCRSLMDWCRLSEANKRCWRFTNWLVKIKTECCFVSVSRLALASENFF